MRIFIQLLIVFTSLAFFAQTGRVIKVKDGDTIVILDSLNTQHTIRVADIDSPEKGQPFSKVAKDFVSAEIFGRTVFVEKTKTDRYGRTVGNIFYDNKNLSEELLRNGLAWHYKYFSDDQVLSELELEARERQIGLWIDKNPVNPYQWRKGVRN